MFKLASLAAVASSAAALADDPSTLCIACEVVLTLVEEKMLLGDEQCEQPACRALLESVGLDSVDGIDPTKISPDTYCHEVLGLCTDECRLFSQWPIVPHPPSPDAAHPIAPEVAAANAHKFVEGLQMLPNTQCGKDWDCLYNKFVEDHLTMQDSDADLYAPSFEQLRNTHWRGKDCDDSRADVHPGAQPIDGDADVDSNCNGIVGGNATGTYEDLFCADYQSVGIAALGDSATAHFHLPPQTLEASDFSLTPLLDSIMDEIDYPQCSWSSGHEDSANCPSLHGGEMDSLYKRMRERNRCAHRDFQNIGTNGASVKNTQRDDGSYLVNSLARDAAADKPMLVVYSLIGNDVCGSKYGPDHYTDPDVFRANVISALDQMDTFLPKGSHVLALGLVDGRVLYDTMHDAQHPLGDSYKDFYTYLNCAEMNPCAGYLNANETVREETADWALNVLNKQYEDILADYQSGALAWNNFEFNYFFADWEAYIADFVAQGGDPVNLIEWADGFHPSGLGNAIMAADIWEWLEDSWPQALGDTNPHNAEIDAMFGDQGGY